MKPALTLLACLSGAAMLVAETLVVCRSFDNDPLGTPAGFAFAAARQAKVGTWIVGGDDGNRYLAHVARPIANGGVSLAVLDGVVVSNPRVTARVKLVGGQRRGGIVWRYRDAQNHYAVALNLKAQEIALYRVAGGNRIRLKREDDLELDVDAWHTLRVVEKGERIRVYLGGIRVFSARARSSAGPGGVGVWSEGGSSNWFDDVRVDSGGER